MKNSTPGPWMLHDMEFATVVTAQKPGLFIALCDSATFTRKENLANAYLCIAAPELFKALEQIRDHYDDTKLAAKHMAAIARSVLTKVTPK